MQNLPPNDDHLDADIRGELARFLRSGGKRETFYSANPELIRSAPPQPQPRPADWLDEAYNRVAVGTLGRVLAKLQRSQRSRQRR